MSESHEGKKVKYITVGTIKTIDLTFPIEPISAYRFQTKVDDENSWKIVFKEDVEDPKELKLIGSDTKFKFASDLSSAFIILKQGKARIKIALDKKEDEVIKFATPDISSVAMVETV